MSETVRPGVAGGWRYRRRQANDHADLRARLAVLGVDTETIDLAVQIARDDEDAAGAGRAGETGAGR